MRTTRRPEISCHRNVRSMQYASLSPSLSLTKTVMLLRESSFHKKKMLMLKSLIWCVNGEKLFSASQRRSWRRREKLWWESEKVSNENVWYERKKEEKYIFLPRAIRSLSFFLYFSLLFRLFPFNVNLCFFLLCNAMLITIWFVWIEILGTVRTFCNRPLRESCEMKKN